MLGRLWPLCSGHSLVLGSVIWVTWLADSWSIWCFWLRWIGEITIPSAVNFHIFVVQLVVVETRCVSQHVGSCFFLKTVLPIAWILWDRYTLHLFRDDQHIFFEKQRGHLYCHASLTVLWHWECGQASGITIPDDPWDWYIYLHYHKNQVNV